MDAFNVAFRVPNLLRDLFAEGRDDRRVRPDVHRTLTRSGREAAWRLGNLVINALLLVTACSSCSASSSPRRSPHARLASRHPEFAARARASSS